MKPPKRISRIVIIGAGVTGLSTAYYLQKLFADSASVPEILIFEQTSRSGGKIATIREENFVVETGPDSIFRSKPWGFQLVRELGIENEIIEPRHDQFYLHREDNSLIKIRGQTLFAPFPSNLETIWRLPFLSLKGKIRASLYRGGQPPDEAMSLEFYLRKLWGKEFADKVAIPLFSSIHSGDAARLSASMVFPALWKKRKPVKGTHGSTPVKSYFGFQTGMSFLTESLERSLTGSKIQFSTRVTSIRQSQSGFSIARENGDVVAADAVVLTVPSFVAAQMLGESAGAISSTLQKIEHASGVVVTLGYKSSDISHPLAATGFISTGRSTPLTGCTFFTSKWSCRAPAGEELFRVFLKGNREQFERTDDESLVKVARKNIEPLLGISAAPLRHFVSRWISSFPQYNLGHPQRLEAISAEESRLKNRLLFAGCSYRGVGIPDCIGQGLEAARKLYDSDHTFQTEKLF